MSKKEKRCKRILPGGSLHKIFTDEEFARKFENTPATNDDPESCFGTIKQIMKENPHINYETASIIARLKINKPFLFYDIMKKENPQNFYQILENCSQGQTKLLNTKKLKILENILKHGEVISDQINASLKIKQDLEKTLPNEIKSLNKPHQQLNIMKKSRNKKHYQQKIRKFYSAQKQIHQYLYPKSTWFNIYHATTGRGQPAWLPFAKLKQNFEEAIRDKYRQIDIDNIQESNDVQTVLNIDIDEITEVEIADIIWDVIDSQDGNFLKSSIEVNYITHTETCPRYISNQ